MRETVSSRASSFVRLFGRYLREQNLPVTHQREAIAGIVFSSEAHLSVEEIEASLRRAGERIGKATIYRTLDLLVRSELVEEHDFNEGFKRYEHRLSRQPEHEHLICLECGEVTEFKSAEIGGIKNRIATERGFRPVRHRLEIYGLCAACRDAGAVLPAGGLTCPIESV